MTDRVRIGGASGFWGDTAMAVPQLLAHGGIDFLVFDYLAELTMSILAAQRRKDPAKGYATDFVEVALRDNLREIVAQRVRVVSNAGGINPLACRDAVLGLAAELGVDLKVGVVLGDDVTGHCERLRAAGVTGMYDGSPIPERVASANAYLGAGPIARALDEGCQIVITGRCVDSAVTLGCLVHAFGWRADDYDRLAQGTLAGHLIECGAQACGGLFTDWQDVPGWDRIGFPVIDAMPDGCFSVGKPADTGGSITPATVAEQMLYEIGDPRAYLVPDVSCDFTDVRFEATGPDRVTVRGARGRAPTQCCKVSLTWVDGWRNSAVLVIIGLDACAKAQRTGEALLARMRRMLADRGLPGFTEARIEVLGSGAQMGPPDAALVQAAAGSALEAVLRITVRSQDRRSLELFAREFVAAGTSMAPGTTGLGGGRPSPSPSVRLLSLLMPSEDLSPEVIVDDRRFAVAMPTGDFDPGLLGAPASVWVREQDAVVGFGRGDTLAPPLDPALGSALVEVALMRIAHGRSGDKGDIANIGILARSAAAWEWLRANLDARSVAAHFGWRGPARVECHELAGCRGLNFVLHGVLGGGGMASSHIDNLAKSYAQQLLAMRVQVPRELLG